MLSVWVGVRLTVDEHVLYDQPTHTMANEDYWSVSKARISELLREIPRSLLDSHSRGAKSFCEACRIAKRPNSTPWQINP